MQSLWRASIFAAIQHDFALRAPKSITGCLVPLYEQAVTYTIAEGSDIKKTMRFCIDVLFDGSPVEYKQASNLTAWYIPNAAKRANTRATWLLDDGEEIYGAVFITGPIHAEHVASFPSSIMIPLPPPLPPPVKKKKRKKKKSPYKRHHYYRY